MISPYSYEDHVKTKSIIDLSLSESKNSKHENPTACLIKAVKHTCILQANIK